MSSMLSIVLYLSALVFPVPTVLLQSDSATLPVADYPVPGSKSFTVIETVRVPDTATLQLLWGLKDHDTLLYGIMGNGTYIRDAGIVYDKRRHNFSRWGVYYYTQGCMGCDGDTAFGYRLHIGSYDTLPAQVETAELAYFAGHLTRLQKESFQTYLAVKYGITLDDIPYISPVGDTLWSEVSDALYYHRIHGIGHDTVSGLNNTLSSSFEDSLIYLMSSAAVSGSYALTGDDDGSLSWNRDNGSLWCLDRRWRLRLHGMNRVNIAVSPILTATADTLYLGIIDETGQIHSLIPADHIDSTGMTCYHLDASGTKDYTFFTNAAVSAQQRTKGRGQSAVSPFEDDEDARMEVYYDSSSHLLYAQTDMEGNRPFVYRLYDSTGKLLDSFHADDAGRVTVSIALPAGVYYVECIGNGQPIVTSKMIVL